MAALVTRPKPTWPRIAEARRSRAPVFCGLTTGAGMRNVGLSDGWPFALNGGMSVTSGPLGAALQFDGTSGYVTVANASNLIASAPAYSMSVWANLPTPAQVTSSNGVSIFGFRVQNAPDNKGDWHVNLLNTGNLEARWSSSANVAYNINAPFSGGWQHLAFTFDSSHIRLYVNGVQVGSTAVSGTFGITGLPFTLGYTQYGIPTYPAWFPNQQDNARLYLCCLTPEEVARDYADPWWLLEQDDDWLPEWAAAAGATGGGGGGGTHGLFLPAMMNGLGAGGPFFGNPIGRHRLPPLDARRRLILPSRKLILPMRKSA